VRLRLGPQARVDVDDVQRAFGVRAALIEVRPYAGASAAAASEQPIGSAATR
jgi:hypothetical protein